MPKVNLTRKSTSEQIRIVKDYLERRTQHSDQGSVKLSQVVKRFKHNKLKSDKDKAVHFRKILRLAQQSWEEELQRRNSGSEEKKESESEKEE